jgi:hypothetical protein
MSSMDDQELVPIPGPGGEPLEIADYATACLLQGILASGGIEAIIPDAAYPLAEWKTGLPLPRLLVLASQAGEAAQIAAAATSGGAEAAEAAERAGEAAGDVPPGDYEPEPAQAKRERPNPARVRIL